MLELVGQGVGFVNCVYGKENKMRYDDYDDWDERDELSGHHAAGAAEARAEDEWDEDEEG